MEAKVGGTAGGVGGGGVGGNGGAGGEGVGGGGGGGLMGAGRGKRGVITRRASLGSQPVVEKWVCPNDRHLALRAKLKMGWSTTTPAPVTRQDSLSEAETKIILEVIKRAEELDIIEQQRIGRLVDKVEVMKGRVQGNGNNNCILCGESLPVLRTSTLLCADCNKRVCSKCGIDTTSPTGEKLWLCKICAETREMWKRSGAWFFRGIPKHILPSSSSSSASSSVSSSSSFFSSSSAPASTRRSRPAPPRRAHTLGFKTNSVSCDGDGDGSSEDEAQRRLKKTASENEENTPNTHHPARSRSVSPSPFRVDSQDSVGAGRGDSSDDHASDRSPLSPAGPQRDLSRAPSRESTGGTGGEVGGLLLSPYYSPTPHQLSPSRSELKRDQAIDRSPSPLLRVAWRDSGRGSNSSVSDSPNQSRDSRDDGEGGGVGSMEGGSGSGPGTPNTTAPPPNTPRSPLPINRSSSSSSASTVGGGVGGIASSPTVNGIRSRRGSETSKSSDERKHPRLARSTGDSRESRGSRDSRDSLLSRESSTRDEVTTSSSVDDVFPEGHHSSGGKDGHGPSEMGYVEFSLLYDSHNQALHCTIHTAKNLRPSDSNRLADPYVKLHLLPGASKSNKLRTRTQSKTINPEFNETLTYYGISDQDMARKTLRLTILDEDRFGHDFLGEARVALRQVIAHETKRLKLSLEKRISLAEDEVKGEAERGKVLLSLKYSSPRAALIVGIVRCAHLPSMDSNGFSDPYVKVHLKPDPTYKKYKTAVKWKNLNPEFNEEFLFEVKRNELPKKLLDIRVYDKDVARHDDFIGGLQLSQDSTGTELRHWYDALQYPDRRHDRWHQLQPLNGK